MCVIIHKPAGVAVAREDIQSAMRVNSDGFGYVFFNPKTNSLVSDKSVSWTEESILRFTDSLTPYEAILHFRIKTHGAVCDKLCHPFVVLSKEDGDAYDLMMAHNGIISKHSTKENDESDTTMFIKEILQPFLKKNSDLLEDPIFKELIESHIGAGSKLAFMRGDGKVIIFNKEAGADIKGCWVSNTYSFGATKSKAATLYDSDYWDNWYHGKNYSNKHNKSNTAVTNYASKNNSAILDGVEYKVGDKIAVFHETERGYWEEGTIEHIYNCTLSVKVPLISGHEAVLSFYRETLKVSPYDKLRAGYELYPYKYEKSEILGQSLDKLNEIQLQDTEDEEIDDEEGDESEDSLWQSLVDYKGTVIDVDNGYGGAFLKDSLAEYEPDDLHKTDNVSIMDVYNMNDNERVAFFVDNPQATYDMLIDLVERLVIEDSEKGIIIDVKDEESEAA